MDQKTPAGNKEAAGFAFREGFHDYTIQRGGVEVYPRLIASEHHLASPRRN